MSKNQENYDAVMAVLHKIHKHTCCYTDLKNNRLGKAPYFCDCKYGGEDVGTLRGEQTGCPELREVIHILEALGPEASARLTGNTKYAEEDSTCLGCVDENKLQTPSDDELLGLFGEGQDSYEGWMIIWCAGVMANRRAMSEAPSGVVKTGECWSCGGTGYEGGVMAHNSPSCSYCDGSGEEYRCNGCFIESHGGELCEVHQ